MMKMLTEPKTKSTNDEQQSSFYKAAILVSIKLQWSSLKMATEDEE